MDVALARPIIYVSTSGLWDTVTLVVFGVVPPPPGQAEPTHDRLARITVAVQQPLRVDLPVLKNPDGTARAFKHVALTFAVTTAPNEVGSALISIVRDEDPLEPDGTRPVHKVIDLTRSAVTSPTFIVKTFALVGTV